LGAYRPIRCCRSRAFIDIGGSGRSPDAFTIWIVQWVGQEIRVLDYYEAVGQVLGRAHRMAAQARLSETRSSICRMTA
jgi:hypothetical protein